MIPRRKTEILIFSLAVAVRIGFSFFLRPDYYWPDEIDYDALARHILQGKEMGIPLRGPLYSLFLAGLYSLTGPNLIAVRIIQAFLDAFSALLVVFLGKRFFGPTTAYLAGFFYGLYPFFVLLSNLLLSETLFIFLFLAVIAEVVIFEETLRRRHLMISGFLLGLMTLCRPNAILYLIPLVLWICWKKVRLRRQVLWGSLFALFALAPVLTWMTKLYLDHDKWVFICIGGGRVLWYGNGPQAVLSGSKPFPKEINEQLLAIESKVPDAISWDYPEARRYMESKTQTFDTVPVTYERDRFLYRQTIEFIRSHPKIFLKNYLKKIALFWMPTSLMRAKNDFNNAYSTLIGGLSYILLLVFFAAGLLVSLKNARRFLLLYLVIVVYVLQAALFTITVRYRVPLDPFLLLFASWALYLLFRAIRDRRLPSTDLSSESRRDE